MWQYTAAKSRGPVKECNQESVFFSSSFSLLDTGSRWMRVCMYICGDKVFDETCEIWQRWTRLCFSTNCGDLYAIVVTCTHARTIELSARVGTGRPKPIIHEATCRRYATIFSSFCSWQETGWLSIIHMAAQLPRSENTLPMQAPKPTASEECSISDNCVK